MLECINCGNEYDGESVPFCEAYDDNKTKCVDVRLCEGCEENEISSGDEFCYRCEREWAQERADREWDYWHA